MAALVEGCQYGLSSLASTSADKSLLHVKLTDSALKAIEEFQKIQNGTSQRPSIQFAADRGEIVVPMQKSADNPEGCRKFRFSIKGDPQGGLDCIHQDAAQMQLSLLGTMSQKLVVKATDDVYKATKERMTQAEEESKKFCAKEIKPGSSVRKVVKKVVRRSGTGASQDHRHSSSAPSSGAISSHSHSKVSISGGGSHRPSSLPLSSSERHHDHHRSSSATGPRHNSPGGAPSSKPQLGKEHQVAPSPGSRQVGPSPGSRRSSPVPGRPQPAGDQRSSSPSQSPHLPSSNSSKPLQNITMTTKSANPAIMNMPLRDRVIHLLALRPYKKLELWNRLQKEGVRDKDKHSMGSVLKAVSVFNHRDNSLSLGRQVYQELRTDWPFYSDEEKDRLRKRLAQEQEVASRTPSPAVSPVHSNSSQHGSPSTAPQKRPSSTSEAYDFPSSKKQRIAHGRRALGEESSRSPQQLAPSPPVKQEATSTSCDSSLSTPKHSDCQEKENKDFLIGTPSPESQDVHHEIVYSAEPSSTSDSPEYHLKYTTICDLEQRRLYKQDFNMDYAVYMQLHASIDKETVIFRELRERLKQQVEGSEDYEKIKNTIFEEYYQLKRDPKYVEQRRRCDHLHRKLGHIKQLIVEFDMAHLAVENS